MTLTGLQRGSTSRATAPFCWGVEVGMETRERSGAAVEKDALFFLRLLTTLLERRVTPRLVNIVNYDVEDDDEGR
jgi:hypothetical protein